MTKEKKALETDYPLIPMNDITDEARLIAVRWHENATGWIGDKHKLASDIMNYARRKNAEANARIKELEAQLSQATKRLQQIENQPNNIDY